MNAVRPPTKAAVTAASFWCVFFHRWSRWSDRQTRAASIKTIEKDKPSWRGDDKREQETITEKEPDIVFQSRTCCNCGLYQERIVDDV